MSRFIGEQLIVLDAVASTNKSAAELLRLSKVQHGAVILANEQTEGRGQRGRQWHSQPGLDLTLSIVLLPEGLRAEEQFGLSKMAALAVRATVAANVPADVRIKWPNDVLVDRHKVAGILIECELEGDRVRSAIVGIGLNVNSLDFPEELMATSLHLSAGVALDRDAILGELLDHFERLYYEWTTDSDRRSEEYARWLWARGRWAEFLLDGEAISARPMDVDPYGRLVVELADGKVAAFGTDRLRFAPR